MVREFVIGTRHCDSIATVNVEGVAHIAVRLTIIRPAVGVGRDGQSNGRFRVGHLQRAGVGRHRVVLHGAIGEDVVRNRIIGLSNCGLGTFDRHRHAVRVNEAVTAHGITVVGQRRTIVHFRSGGSRYGQRSRVDLQRTDDRGHRVLGAHIRGAIHNGVGRVVVRHSTLRHVGGGVAHEGHRQLILTVRESNRRAGSVCLSRGLPAHRVGRRIVRRAVIRPLAGSGGEGNFRGREGHRDLAVHVGDLIVGIK